MAEDLSDNDELCLALGHMVQGAASLEFMLRLLASGLSESSHGSLIMAGESASQLIVLSLALAEKQETPERVASLKTILNECKAAFERRNQYVHGLWTVSHETREWSTMRSRRNRDDWQQVAAKAEDLHDLDETFSRLYHRISDWQVEPHLPELRKMKPLIAEDQPGRAAGW
jgi:hypothetical protein